MQSAPLHPTLIEYALDIALCRSALYEVLALGFRPPTPALLSRLLTPEAAAILEQAAAVLDAAWQTDLSQYLCRLRTSSGEEPLPVLEAAFRGLFGHIARGPVPPYETEYGEDSLFLPIQEMSDLGGFLRAFGLILSPAAHERVDHISSECEFLLFLACKEAYALEGGELDLQQEVLHATRLFLRDHLGRWAPAFGARLVREDAEGFYGTLGGLCHTLISADCTRLGVSAGPVTLRLRAPLQDNAPMACGAGEALLQIALPTATERAHE
jgi:TorA maturation chaperone TorD